MENKALEARLHEIAMVRLANRPDLLLVFDFELLVGRVVGILGLRYVAEPVTGLVLSADQIDYRLCKIVDKWAERYRPKIRINSAPPHFDPLPVVRHAFTVVTEATPARKAQIPAPSASAPAVVRPEAVAPPAEAVTVAPKGVQKREMVRRHVARWPTIKTDMQDAATNGLAAAAKAGERGWREAAALDWARERSRLLSAPEPGTLDAVMGGGFPSRRHTLAR